MPGAESNIEDELLKRFNALRAPTSEPIVPVSNASDPSRAVDEAARSARKEDEELDAIAEGRVLPSSSALRPSQGQEEDDLSRRMKELKGGQGGYAFEMDENDMPDDEVGCLKDES